ncbi:MAG: hypothetical protein MUQ10_20175 [Anaerolineae bacterium]|nr:hypothetical protein [Anaerolineae bacterium]
MQEPEPPAPRVTVGRVRIGLSEIAVLHHVEGRRPRAEREVGTHVHSIRVSDSQSPEITPLPLCSAQFSRRPSIPLVQSRPQAPRRKRDKALFCLIAVNVGFWVTIKGIWTRPLSLTVVTRLVAGSDLYRRSLVDGAPPEQLISAADQLDVCVGRPVRDLARQLDSDRL